MDRGASSFLYFSQEPGHRPMACRALHHQAVIPDLVNCLNTSARVHQCTVKTSLPMPKKPAVVGLELSFSQTMMWFQWVERCEKCPALIRGVVPRAAACLDPMETVLHNVAHTRSRVSSVVADRRCAFPERVFQIILPDRRRVIRKGKIRGSGKPSHSTGSAKLESPHIGAEWVPDSRRPSPGPASDWTHPLELFSHLCFPTSRDYDIPTFRESGDGNNFSLASMQA